MDNPFDAAERDVLTENTAQSILKHLNRLEEKKPILGARWIWELLQNARDAAPPTTGVNISVQLADGELRFRHDGRAFKYKELAHLIYHGTTKLDGEDDVGHFGSGFVSTHLLSRRVRVLGLVEDGKRFDFWLDRSSSDQHELAAAMQRSMDECKLSCEATHDASLHRETEFTYPLDDEGMSLAREATEDLKAWGPLVLALAPEITSVSVCTNGATWRLDRGVPRPLADTLELATINLRRGENEPPVPHHVAVARLDGRVQVALPLSRSGEQFSVALDERTPRVFVLFPLLGTDKLALPAVLQSKEFEPFEDRDGIWLSGASPTAMTNRAIVERALSAVRLLVETAAAQKWGESYRLLAFDTSRLPQWVDESWLSQLLVKVLDQVKTVALIPTLDGDWVTVERAWLPVADDPTLQATLWELASGWADSATKLPPQESFVAWSRNLVGWVHLLKCPVNKHPAAFTIARLAEMVSSTETVANLSSQLHDADSAMSWLSRFLNLVQESSQTSLHDDLSLLPNQRGRMCRRRDLSVDSEIADDLKDVGAAFGVDVRSGLLDASLNVPGLEKLLPAKTEEQVIDEIVATHKKACQGGRLPATMVQANVDLFWWLASREKYAARLNGFLVATNDEGEDSCLVVELPVNGKQEERLLAPPSVWPEGVRIFSALFPKRKVLNAAYAEEVWEAARWAQLQVMGLVHMEPLHQTPSRMDDLLPVEALADDKDHRSDQDIPSSHIACLSDKDIGLIDTARKSRPRAIQLLEFLVESVLATDRNAFQLIGVQCECTQEHKVFRAAWLAPLRSRKWIPPEADGHGAELASAESFARLLRGRPELVRQFESESGRSLLQALGISPADFALRVVAPDEETRVSLIRSVGDLAQAAGGAEGVRKLVDDIQNDPDILISIAERKENRERVRRNQGIGRLVEQLLRDQLEARGLRVQRTGIGSDFEVDSDFVEEDHEVLLKLDAEGTSMLLEVKSARGDRVKMTPKQAETACGAKDGFALCVVPILDEVPSEETIREQSRFVFGIGAQLTEALAGYQNIEAATDAARHSAGHVELEIIEGQTRFKVGRDIWANGLDFSSAIEHVLRRSDSARKAQAAEAGSETADAAKP